MDSNGIPNLTSSSTIWVGNNPYFVSPSGIIPLTSGLSALSLGPNQMAAQASLPNNQGNQYYVVSVQESPIKTPSILLNNPRTGLGFYDGSSLTASTPNLGYSNGINNFNNLQFQPQPFAQPQLTSTISPGLPGQPYTAALFSGLPVNQQLMTQNISNGLNNMSNGNQPYLNSLTNLDPRQQTSQPPSQPSSQPSSQRTSTASNQSDFLPHPSPNPSLSSMSIQSESSYGTLPSPEISANCIYDSSDSRNNSGDQSSLLDSKDKRSSVGEVFESNDIDKSPKPIYAPVAPCYDKPLNKECCLKCGKKVYAMEKLGPVKDCLYHKLCFSCVVCGTILNLKNYHVNPNDLEDLNVYCSTHMPSNKVVSVDAASVGIKGALRVPKLNIINDQIRGGKDVGKANKVKYSGHTYNLDAESRHNNHHDTASREYAYDNSARRYYYAHSNNS